MNIIASGLGKASFYRKGHIRTLFSGWDTFEFKDWSRSGLSVIIKFYCNK